MSGPFTPMAVATPEVQKVADTVKPYMEDQLGRKLDVYRAMFYRYQVVAGTVYLIKVQIGSGDEHIHIRVYDPPPGHRSNPTLVGMQRDKTSSDPIDFF